PPHQRLAPSNSTPNPLSSSYRNLREFLHNSGLWSGGEFVEVRPGLRQGRNSTIPCLAKKDSLNLFGGPARNRHHMWTLFSGPRPRCPVQRSGIFPRHLRQGRLTHQTPDLLDEA